MTEFAKEGAISFGDKTIPAYDYSISIVGPSDRFVTQGELASQQGLGFWIKTEHAISLEFIDVPYIPVFFQWAERFRKLRESPHATAQFDNWMHYGFTPSLAADVFYWNIWSDAPSAEPVLHPSHAALSDAMRKMMPFAPGSFLVPRYMSIRSPVLWRWVRSRKVRRIRSFSTLTTSRFIPVGGSSKMT